MIVNWPNIEIQSEKEKRAANLWWMNGHFDDVYSYQLVANNEDEYYRFHPANQQTFDAKPGRLAQLVRVPR